MMESAIEVLQVFRSSWPGPPVFVEAAVTIDRAGGYRREEQQERTVFEDWQRRDQAILNADDDIKAAKSHIRNTEKPDQTLRVKKGRSFYGQKRQKRPQNGNIEDPAVINSRPNE